MRAPRAKVSKGRIYCVTLPSVWPRLRASLLPIAPAILFLIVDFEQRGSRVVALSGVPRGAYCISFLTSVILWGSLLYTAASRLGPERWLFRIGFVALFTGCMGGQLYFFSQYNLYMNVDSWAFASNFVTSILNQLGADLHNYLFTQFPALLGSLILLWAGRTWLAPKANRLRLARWAVGLSLAVAFFVPLGPAQAQASLPDILFFNALGGLVRAQAHMARPTDGPLPRLRSSLPVPPLTSRVATPRNIVLIILESVRADATCIDFDPDCRKTQFSNRVLPSRYGLTQMRALDSTTSVSLAVLWAGIGPNEANETLHTWPLLFDYAKASGWATAYWTSQNMAFGNSRLWVKNLDVNQIISAQDLDANSDLDLGAPEGLLADRIGREIGKLSEPFLAVIQLSNVHYPYAVDPNGAQPFQPASTSKAPADTAEFFNHYQNAVYQEDAHIADMIGHIRQSEHGNRAVIVYTSDHGEAFREHSQMGHTFSVLDEEIHVPAWIDAPPGILTPDQERNLRGKHNAYT
ncbi:MAG TPA: sulfatase-like hydrolase/transferase, partial [Polyangiaceae bacterium]|nr:sulfatase-like hydrolase/transferase [Polyangiaceae bacterium]